MKSRLLIVACCLALASCGSVNFWPFGKKKQRPLERVDELQLVYADGKPADFPQYWTRNTLVIDLSGASGTGGIAARLPPDTTWPVRMAVRVYPGGVQQIEILGEERNVLPVIATGSKTVDIDVAPSVYTPRTAAIYVSWGPMPVFAEAAAPTPEPGFVSPTVVPTTPAPAPAPSSTEEAPSPSASEIIPPGSTPAPQPSPGS